MRFPAPRVGVAVTVVAALLIWRGLVVNAQQPSGSEGGDLAKLYSQGMAAFQAGDYARAANDLDALLNKAEFSPQLEPAFFSLGSAYFNAADYKKAITAFKNYKSKFPTALPPSYALYGV